MQRGPYKGQILDELASRTVTAMGSVERTERSVISPKARDFKDGIDEFKTIEVQNAVNSERPVTVQDDRVEAEAGHDCYLESADGRMAAQNKTRNVLRPGGETGWSQQDSTLK